ncbi:MAG TPA: hypothetical protein DCM45_00210 [Clostridiales bacterium]|nr:hypothetical protein [Clostridiales bacterium]
MNRKFFIILVAWLIVMMSGCTPAGSTTGPTAATTEQTTATTAWQDQHTLGTWWWNAQFIRTETDRDLRLQFLQDEGVSEIYLYYGGVVWDKYYRQFIAACQTRGIRVAALGGDAGWLSDEGFAGYQRWLARIAQYQADASESEKFYGLHLDFEPGQNPEYAKDPSAMAGQVSRVYDLGRQFSDEHALIFEADVSMWIDDPEHLMPDGAEQVALGEYIARRVDTLSIMAYRDTAREQYQSALPMIRIARQYNRKVIMGSETGQSTEAEFVSYFEEGKAVLQKEQVRLIGLMDKEDVEYGLAVHYVESWFELKD